MLKTYNIGILYESDEWSDHKLAMELRKAFQEIPDVAKSANYEVRLISMMDDNCVFQALSCDLLISRVFASAAFRGHAKALAAMEKLLAALANTNIPIINEAQAHRFETSKRAAMEAMQSAGILVPKLWVWGRLDQWDLSRLSYPCVIKPDCGGRTTWTTIAHDVSEVEAFIDDTPPLQFLGEEYIAPERGYITRIEIVGNEPKLVVKRGIAENGLSAYRFGSTFESYEDCPPSVLEEASKAASVLGFTFGSFDIIETDRGAYFIDANSVSNVSEDCTDLLGLDLMKAYAQTLAVMIQAEIHEKESA